MKYSHNHCFSSNLCKGEIRFNRGSVGQTEYSVCQAKTL